VTTPQIISIQVGRPQQRGSDQAPDPLDQPWVSAIFKAPAAEPVWLAAHNLAGDEQADLKNHGGADKAILFYAAAHYPQWIQTLGVDLPYGAFGENLTVSELHEEVVCIGDRYQLGEGADAAVVQVSVPRGPCYKLARRWHIADLPDQVRANGHTGWYARVEKEGWLAAGMPITLLERPHPEWPVMHATRVWQQKKDNPEAAAALADCPALASHWREVLRTIRS
jgi:MOSC domain-containing protein YiiM